MRRTFLLGLLLWLIASPAWAVTYYINRTTGSDSDDGLTEGNAFLTINKCFNTIGTAVGAGAGDRCSIKGTGTYAEALEDNWPGGIWTNPFTLANDSGGTVTIQPGTGGNQHVIDIVRPTSKHIIIDGVVANTLVIDGINRHSAAIQIGSNTCGSAANCAGFITIRKIECKNAALNSTNGAGCIQTKPGADDNTFEDNIVHDTGDTVNKDHGFYIESARNVVRRNRAYNNAAAGIKLGSDTSGVVNDNHVYDNYVYNNGLEAGTTPAMLCQHGSRNQFYRNLVFSNYSAAFEAFGGCHDLLFYNNVIHEYGTGNGRTAIRYGNYQPCSNLVFRNNIIRGTPSAFQNGGLCTGVITTLNQTTGTVGVLFIDPSNATLASRNYNLLEASASIDAGQTSVCASGSETCTPTLNVTKNGSLPDYGAFEAPIFSSCSVEDGDATKVRVLFANTRGTPMQGSAAANWAAVVAGSGATETAVTHVGSTRTDITLGSAVTNGQSVTIAYTRPSSSMLTNSDKLGNLVNAAVRTFTAQSCTNNVGAAPGVTYEQIRYGWYSWLGVEDTGELLFEGVENTNLSLHPNACIALRTKMECNGGSCPAKAVNLRYSRNAGAYTLIPDLVDTDKLMYSACPSMPTGTPTTERLTSGVGAYTAGTVRGIQSAIENITLAQDAQTEFVDCVCFVAATPTDTYAFRLYDQAGTALDTYTATPTATIGNRRSTWR